MKRYKQLLNYVYIEKLKKYFLVACKKVQSKKDHTHDIAVYLERRYLPI